MHSPSIVIISHETDAHIPYVSKFLKKDTFVIIDPETIIKHNELSYYISKGKTEVVYKGIPLNEVKSVWYRKPSIPKVETLPVPEEYRKYSFDALKKHANWLFSRFENALWISHYEAINLASDKISQLTLARKLGFLVPDTLLTSSSEAAEKFLNKYDVSIIKPISAYSFPMLDEQGKETHVIFYSTKVHRGQQVDLNNLHLAPAMFQQAVTDVIGDLRVTVVGEKVFTALITNPEFDEEEHGTRDWRVGHETGTIVIEPYDKLPDDIAKLCIAHVKEQGLNFGAIDLVLDKKGKIWFLENNPNGQWAFIEEITGQPMGEELAYFLVNGKNKK